MHAGTQGWLHGGRHSEGHASIKHRSVRSKNDPKKTKDRSSQPLPFTSGDLDVTQRGMVATWIQFPEPCVSHSLLDVRVSLGDDPSTKELECPRAIFPRARLRARLRANRATPWNNLGDRQTRPDAWCMRRAQEMQGIPNSPAKPHDYCPHA
jgi:hypothetical protein